MLPKKENKDESVPPELDFLDESFKDYLKDDMDIEEGFEDVESLDDLSGAGHDINNILNSLDEELDEWEEYMDSQWSSIIGSDPSENK